MATSFVRIPSRSHILEQIGILRRGSERCEPEWPLTVTQQLLHPHVTAELQGRMGKFVQLSTQIRAYRNCWGRREEGAFCVYACTCVYTEMLRTDNSGAGPNGAGGIPAAGAETPPCRLRRAVPTPLPEQTSPWPVSIHPPLAVVQGRPPAPASELDKQNKP